MADTLPAVKGDVVRADIALKEQLNRFYGDAQVADIIYKTRHELFILLTDWVTRIEQGLPVDESTKHERQRDLDSYVQES